MYYLAPRCGPPRTQPARDAFQSGDSASVSARFPHDPSGDSANTFLALPHDPSAIRPNVYRAPNESAREIRRQRETCCRRGVSRKRFSSFVSHTPDNASALPHFTWYSSPDMLLCVARYLMNSSAVEMRLPAN